jgi:hypothetical protein
VSEPERIECAAVRVGGVVYQVPRPERHCDAIRLAIAAGADYVVQSEQGFVTSTGRFVDRAEAAALAQKAGQIVGLRTRLFSEDLW